MRVSQIPVKCRFSPGTQSLSTDPPHSDGFTLAHCRCAFPTSADQFDRWKCVPHVSPPHSTARPTKEPHVGRMFSPSLRRRAKWSSGCTSPHYRELPSTPNLLFRIGYARDVYGPRRIAGPRISPAPLLAPLGRFTASASEPGALSAAPLTFPAITRNRVQIRTFPRRKTRTFCAHWCFSTAHQKKLLPRGAATKGFHHLLEPRRK